MSWFEYYFQHVLPTGFLTLSSAFKIWGDLMTGNYEGYALLDDDDPFQCCYDWFWGTLGEDDVYEKEFLEYLFKLADDVDKGIMPVYPMDVNQFNRINELLYDVEIDEE